MIRTVSTKGGARAWRAADRAAAHRASRDRPKETGADGRSAGPRSSHRPKGGAGRPCGCEGHALQSPSVHDPVAAATQAVQNDCLAGVARIGEAHRSSGQRAGHGSAERVALISLAQHTADPGADGRGRRKDRSGTALLAARPGSGPRPCPSRRRRPGGRSGRAGRSASVSCRVSFDCL